MKSTPLHYCNTTKTRVHNNKEILGRFHCTSEEIIIVNYALKVVAKAHDDRNLHFDDLPRPQDVTECINFFAISKVSCLIPTWQFLAHS